MIKPSDSNLFRRLKGRATETRLVRYLDLQRRLRLDQPNWRTIVDTAEYEDLLRTGKQGQPVLVATSMGGYLSGTWTESFLALALIARRVPVHVLLCDGLLPACHQSAQRFIDARSLARRGPDFLFCNACFAPAHTMYSDLGIKVHRYSDWITPAEKMQAGDFAAAVDYDEIPTSTYDGVPVGEHAIAGAIRFYARGQLDGDAVTQQIVRRYLAAAVMTTILSRRLLQSIPFQAAVFHHGIYVPQGVIGDVARQLDVHVVNWHVAYRKKCFVFSHDRTYHHTMMDEPTSTWEGLEWTPALDEELMNYLKSRASGAGDWIKFNEAPRTEIDAISRETGVNFQKPCIGLLTNVMWDAQIHYPANVFRDMLDWLLKTVAYFANRPEVQLLIRVHPAELASALPSLQPVLTELRQKYPSLPPNVFVIPPESKLSTYAAMLQCNAAIIYGTKTGVELTALGIPVIVAGEAWIRNKGISRDVVSEADYYSALDELPLPGRLDAPITERARKYAYHFFFRRMIPLTSAVMVPGSTSPEFRVERIADLSPGRDAGLDIICDGILTGSPFVYPAENFRNQS